MPIVEADLQVGASRAGVRDDRRRAARDPRRGVRARRPSGAEMTTWLTPLDPIGLSRHRAARAGGGYRSRRHHDRRHRAIGSAARGVFLVKADCVLAGLDVALEAFRQLEPGRPGHASKARRRPLPRRRGHRRSGRFGARAADRRTDGAQFSSAAVRHRHADAAVRRRGRPAASSCSTRARRRRRCGRWRSTPCAPAAPRIIAPGSSTRS